MKAIIGTAIGVLGLGGALVASSGRTSSAPVSPQAGTAVVSAERAGVTAGPALVDCGEGREAVVQPSNAANGISRVECVASATVPATYGAPVMGAQFAPAQPVYAQPRPVQTVVQERVVYRDRPVYRSTSRASARRASTTYSQPSYRTEARRPGRSWKKSAAIIGGSTAAGAGVGAVLGGKSGAKKGAVVGLVGGTVYDIATRNKDNR